MNTRPSGYLLLLAGHIVSTFGNSIYVITLVLYLAHATDSARTLGLVQFLSYLPAALLGPLAGAAVDLWDRKRIIVWSDLLRGIIMIATAAIACSLGTLPVWVLMAATVGISVAGVIFVPAVHAIIPELVEPARLKRANGARSAGVQIANLAGSAFGGALYVLLGAPLVILANGVSFLLSGVSETGIKVPPRPRGTAQTGLGRRAGEGLRFLLQHRDVRSVVIVQALMNLLFPPLVVMLPFVITDTWLLSPDYFGYLFGAVLAGGVAGFVSFSGARTSDRLESILYALGIPVITLVVLGLGVLSSPVGIGFRALVPALFGLMFLAGLAVGVMHMIGITTLQEAVAPGMRGRVFAAMEMLTAGLLPLAYVGTGFLAEALRPTPHHHFLLVAVGSALLSGFVVMNRPRKRAYS